jgi:hypothetical protein
VVGLFRIGGVAEMSQRSENISARGFNSLNAELNSICHLLALLGAHHILYVSRIRVNSSFASNYEYELFGLYGIEDIVTAENLNSVNIFRHIALSSCLSDERNSPLPLVIKPMNYVATFLLV